MRQLQGIFAPIYVADGSIVAIGEGYVVEYVRDAKGHALPLPVTATVRDILLVGGGRRMIADTPENVEAAIQVIKKWELYT